MTEFGRVITQNEHNLHNGNFQFIGEQIEQKSGFIGVDDIKNTYLPMGFSNFKIEGRGLGSAMILEFLLYLYDEATVSDTCQSAHMSR